MPLVNLFNESFALVKLNLMAVCPIRDLHRSQMISWWVRPEPCQPTSVFSLSQPSLTSVSC